MREKTEIQIKTIIIFFKKKFTTIDINLQSKTLNILILIDHNLDLTLPSPYFTVTYPIPYKPKPLKLDLIQIENLLPALSL